MPEPSPSSSSSSYTEFSPATVPRTRKRLWPFTFFLSVLAPVVVAVLLYHIESFDPAAYPAHELARKEPVFVPKRNSHMLSCSEKIGVAQLLAPEDIAYEPKSGLIYTGCADGWIKRVTMNESVADSVVENWINTGGRPLGIVHGYHGEVIVADADKGLLNISSDGEVQLLTNEAEGLKFKLTDAVDITRDGSLYFTDASSKYRFSNFIWDFLEGRPYGRLMKYDPTTKQTSVLVQDLYFANGVAVSPDESFVIFCETAMGRCKRYYIQGEKKGSVDVFIDNMPGLPDNIRYDGGSHYWIALSTELTYGWDIAQRYPFLRKIMAIMTKYIGRLHMEKNGGVLAVDLEGKPIAHYYDPQLSLVSSGIKIGDYLYCGSVVNPYIMRLNLVQNPAVTAT